MRDMDPEATQLLFSSSIVRLEKTRCLRARRGLSCEECKTENQIAIPLSGVNVRHIGGDEYTIAPSHATLSNRHEPYWVSHPHGSGESQLTIVFSDRVLLGILEPTDPYATDRKYLFSRRQLAIAPRVHLAAQLLMRSALQSTTPALELEEVLIDLIQRLFSHGHSNAIQHGARDRKLAQNTEALIAARFFESIGLEDLSAMLQVSAPHLCRAFKRATGATIWSRVRQLRSRAALERLAEGETDLTQLALSLGYAQHSHFTASFRRDVGMTPSDARRLIAAGSLARVRALLD